MDYYNDNDPKICAWLRELIKAKLIPKGDVDERCIKEVKAGDLKGYRRVHFFAGIGGWAEALRLAGWPASRPVWTGSCPCQPFSQAGEGKAGSDARHLWPWFFRLIKKCRPATVFGEQVNSKLGYRWLARVQHDVEVEAYALGRADIAACCMGTPQRRGRLYWVADSGEEGLALSKHQTRLGKVGPWSEGCAAIELRLPPGATIRQRARIEPGTMPLANGFPSRVDLIRGYGNAIVPQVGAAFIRAYLEAESELNQSAVKGEPCQS